ncbi:MAG TPA: hypothetical protein VFP62_01725 [Burkholderiales bacterium]|nr:hypothetical protein [Burkholderiales bacterium]
MLKTAALVIEAAVLIGVVTYFAIVGFANNLAVTAILALVAATSVAMLGNALLERRQRQSPK